MSSRRPDPAWPRPIRSGRSRSWCPNPAGGSVDVVARLLGAAIGSELGGSIVIENKGGGAGAVGTASVARAAPDGHVLLLGTQQTHAANVSLLKTLPYDPVRDFTAVAGLAVVPHLLVARKGLGPTDMSGLLALARSEPGRLTYGSTGLGSSSQLAMELFRKQAAIAPLVHVPFRGAGPLVQELLGGRIDIAMISISTVIGSVASGDLTALAVARGARTPLLPDLPTTTEAGVPGVDADAWFALFAPAATPRNIVDQLYRSVETAMGRADIRAKLQDQGIVPMLRPGAEVTKELPAEIGRWAGVVRDAGITPD